MADEDHTDPGPDLDPERMSGSPAEANPGDPVDGAAEAGAQSDETTPSSTSGDANTDVPAPALDDLILAGVSDVLGQLILHFPSRDVSFVVDRRAAATALDLFARRKHVSPDRFTPGSSDMRNVWFASDLNEALAISWWPGIPKRPARTIIDPAPTARG